MSNLGISGIDVRQSGGVLVVRALLQNTAGIIITTGITSLWLYELQDDGTLKSFDFFDNTFKTTVLTTETTDLTHQLGNAGTTDTGLWTVAITDLSGFTAGAVYIAEIENVAAVPPTQAREFQFGGVEGDPATAIWEFANRSLSGPIDATLAATALDAIIVATGLSGRFTTVSGAPVTTLNLRQGISLLLSVMTGDRNGVGTRQITANLPGDPVNLVATRVSQSEIQSTATVPD